MEDKKEIHICEQCGNKHDGSYGSGRFCSMSCKQKFIANKPGKVHKCKYCEKEFETSQKLGAHVRCCKQNPNWQKAVQKRSETVKQNTNIRNPIIHVKLICKECGNAYELDIRQNQFENGDYKHFCSSSCAKRYSASFVDPQKIKNSLQKSVAFQQSIVKQRKLYICKHCGRKFTINESYIHSRKYCSKKCMEEMRHDKLSKSMSQRQEAGLMNRNYKAGIYHGIYCASSWELVFVIYCLDHQLNIKRCKKHFDYKYKKQLKRYFPDFEIDNTIYEIKGFESELAKYKHKLFPFIKYITEKEKKKYFEYVINTYGKNYLDLYDIKYFK